MNRKKIDRLIGILYSIAAIPVLLGAFFRLQHYPYGYQMLWGGFIFGTIVSSYDNIRLKKIIKNLEERKFVD
jgi:uncharacterized membrane protein